jgi:2-keto-4-pentenoate hydratase/2-oxohepta-3-ene-1,7-dioic acid hydratase in catechol pathway
MTKDMAKGNQLGPYLVTLDEAGDPYDLTVTVTVDGQPRFHGSTSEIDHKAEAVFDFLETMAPLQPGTVIGCGTIPDCTGLDHDDFLDPGAEVEIAFERLGTLHCRLAEPEGTLLPSRWPVRSPLLAYHAS